MDYSPPPLFKQGPSALVRLVVFVLLAFGLLFTDAHFHTLKLVRQVVSTALFPLQRIAMVPRDAALGTLEFFVSGSHLRAENADLKARNLQLGLAAARAAELNVENVHLRALLQLAERSPIKPIPAEIQYDARDPFTQKVVIDHGMQAGVNAGAPVITEDGLVGQVTRVYPLQSEVTMLTDRDSAVPVQIVRTGVRSVLYGTANGDLLDLRFVPTGADIKAGDELVTSGLDGVYPSGLPVARVLRIERQSDSAFAHVVAAPIAQIRGVRQLLVLHYQETIPPNPLDAPVETPSKNSTHKGTRKGDAASAASGAPGASGTSAATNNAATMAAVAATAAAAKSLTSGASAASLAANAQTRSANPGHASPTAKPAANGTASRADVLAARRQSIAERRRERAQAAEQRRLAAESMPSGRPPATRPGVPASVTPGAGGNAQ